MSSPYRDAPSSLACPRCGQPLEGIRDGLGACLACGGIWLGTAAITIAFGARVWPFGTNVWWKRELVCPVCAEDMAAILSEGVVVDRCDRHGVWLDPGELGRLLDAPAAEELTALYRRIAPNETMPEIAARRAVRDATRAELRREVEERASRSAVTSESLHAEIAGHLARLAQLQDQVRETEIALAVARRKLAALE